MVFTGVAGRRLKGYSKYLVILLAAAWRPDYWQAWGWWGVNAAILAVLAYVFRRGKYRVRENPRRDIGEIRWKGELFKYYVWLNYAMLITAGLDAGRFRWSPALSPAVYAAATAAFVAAHFLVWWSFQAGLVPARGGIPAGAPDDDVVRGGPFRFVRHPEKLGMIILMPAATQMLGSLWGLLPAAVVSAEYLLVTVLDDRLRLTKIAGYTDYARDVRYRLVPGVW